MKYIKPNGTEIEINENSVEYAEAQGWEKADKPKPAPQKKAPKKKAPVKKAD